MNYLTVKNNGGDPTNMGWPAGQTRCYSYPYALTCAEGEFRFNALTMAQKIAQSSPTPPAGTYQLRDCGGTPTPTPTPGEPGVLEDEITFTGENKSDAPSNNPGVMSITYTYLNNGQFFVKVSANDKANLWIVYNTMQPYLSVADVESRTYRCGVPHLFQGYIMPGVPDDSRRSDSTPNAHQILSVF